jgi:hypothetical protein
MPGYEIGCCTGYYLTRQKLPRRTKITGRGKHRRIWHYPASTDQNSSCRVVTAATSGPPTNTSIGGTGAIGSEPFYFES